MVVPSGFAFERGDPIGGCYFSISYSLANTFVVFEKKDYDGEVTVVNVPVSKRELLRFVKALNRAGFASWLAEYPDNDNRETTGASYWAYAVRTKGKWYGSSGRNGDPPESVAVAQALKKLVKVDSFY